MPWLWRNQMQLTVERCACWEWWSNCFRGVTAFVRQRIHDVGLRSQLPLNKQNKDRGALVQGTKSCITKLNTFMFRLTW